jgi:hypothetical protein
MESVHRFGMTGQQVEKAKGSGKERKKEVLF